MTTSSISPSPSPQPVQEAKDRTSIVSHEDVSTMSSADRETLINTTIAGGDLRAIDALIPLVGHSSIKAAAERYGSIDVQAHVDAMGQANAASAPGGAITNDQMQNASQRVHVTTIDLKAARQAADDLGKTFQAEVAELGPSLSDEQKAQYFEAFKLRHPEVYSRLGDAAAKLTAAMEDPAFRAAVTSLGGNIDAGSSAKLAIDGMRAIADAGVGAGDAAEWLVQTLETNPTAGANLSQWCDGRDNSDKSLPDLLTRLAQADLAQRTLAGEPLETTLAGIGDWADRAAKLGIGTTALVQVVSGVGDLAIARRSGDVAALARAEQRLGSLEMGDGLKVFATGAAIVLFQGSTDGPTKAAALIDAMGGTAELAAKAISQFSATGATMTQGGTAAATSKILERAGSFLGTASNVLSLIADASEVDASSLGGQLVLAGDVAVLAAGVLAASGPWGLAVAGVGMLLQGIGAVVSGNDEQQDRNSEKSAILASMGLDPALGQLEFGGKQDPRMYERMRTELSMSPEQINAALAKYPDLAQGLVCPILIEAARACDVDGADVIGFVESMMRNPRTPDVVSVVQTLSTGSRMAAGAAGTTRWTMLEAINKQFLGTASEYITERNPELAAQLASRLEADQQVGPMLSNMSTQQILTTQFSTSDHDRAYRAEVISLLLARGNAEAPNDGATAVDQMVAIAAQQGDPAVKQALAEAIRANHADDPTSMGFNQANTLLIALGADPIPRLPDGGMTAI